MKPKLSRHFEKRSPSVIRIAQIEYLKRKDSTEAVNVAIGNVSLPMHPAMVRRLADLRAEGSPFAGGAVMYTPTAGMEEARQAFLHVIASCGFKTEELSVQITDGGSQAMELVILGVCGEGADRPLLTIDPTYTNYTAMASRLGRSTVSLQRRLQPDGRFTLPDSARIEQLIVKHRPGALLVIPYDNPTGQLYNRRQMIDLADLCVKYNMWMISDEAYRQLYYSGDETVSVWGITDREVAGIEGRRIGIETVSKVWNACGLRIGALVTDNEDFHKHSVAEGTANLCANAIGQYIFASLLQESHESLRRWYGKQREYYKSLMVWQVEELKRVLPGVVVSSPDAAIYSVVDVRQIVGPDFDAMEFVLFCAKKGSVPIEGKPYTLLVAPMSGFYDLPKAENPGRTQMRIAYVAPPEKMKKVPTLFKELLHRYRELTAKKDLVGSAV